MSFEEKLTIDWIIDTLKRDGINSKKIVRYRLRDATKEELKDLSNDAFVKYAKLDVKENAEKVSYNVPNAKFNDNICHKLVEKFGKDQVIVAIEELSELQKELCKSLRDNLNQDNLLEELADTYIMLKQMKILFNISPYDLMKKIDRKLQRTKERLL